MPTTMLHAAQIDHSARWAPIVKIQSMQYVHDSHTSLARLGNCLFDLGECHGWCVKHVDNLSIDRHLW